MEHRIVEQGRIARALDLATNFAGWAPAITGMAFDNFVAMERMAALEWATQALLGFQLTVTLTRAFAQLPRESKLDEGTDVQRDAA
jgi:hypothetical protein